MKHTFEMIKLTISGLVACAALISFLAGPGKDFARSLAIDYLGLSEPSGGKCATIPDSGHFISDTAIGEWGIVEWRGVVRHRDDCGKPRVVGVIANGGGVLHDSPLSISGIDLPTGTQPISYRFQVPSGVRVGAGRFRVVVDYPEAVGGSPPARSPWLSFNIKSPTLSSP